MAGKNNIRSIRFSDKLAELIDRQQGENFTAKLENLVYRCVWELPEKEKAVKWTEKQLQAKRKQLQKMTLQAEELQMTLNALARQAAELQAAVNQAIKKWDV